MEVDLPDHQQDEQQPRRQFRIVDVPSDTSFELEVVANLYQGERETAL